MRCCTLRFGSVAVLCGAVLYVTVYVQRDRTANSANFGKIQFFSLTVRKASYSVGDLF